MELNRTSNIFYNEIASHTPVDNIASNANKIVATDSATDVSTQATETTFHDNVGSSDSTIQLMHLLVGMRNRLRNTVTVSFSDPTSQSAESVAKQVLSNGMSEATRA